MNLTAIKNNVIIKRLEKNLQRESGIILKSTDEADRAEVISAGADAPEVSTGDIVLVNWNKAIKIKDETYRVVVEDIVAIFED